MSAAPHYITLEQQHIMPVCGGDTPPPTKQETFRQVRGEFRSGGGGAFLIIDPQV